MSTDTSSIMSSPRQISDSFIRVDCPRRRRSLGLVVTSLNCGPLEWPGVWTSDFTEVKGSHGTTRVNILTTSLFLSLKTRNDPSYLYTYPFLTQLKVPLFYTRNILSFYGCIHNRNKLK